MKLTINKDNETMKIYTNTRSIGVACCFIMPLTLIFPSVTNAQSFVTLYGLLSEGFVYNTNAGGKKLTQLASGTEQLPRLGFKGGEDLGGGPSAIFVLENGFSLTTGALGQGGRMFGRQAYVGFANPTFGTLTLGRQYEEMNS